MQKKGILLWSQAQFLALEDPFGVCEVLELFFVAQLIPVCWRTGSKPPTEA